MRPDGLKPVLDRLYAGFNHPDSATDPIQVVRRYHRDDDREIVGFVAASLAFGRVMSVLQSIERVLAVMGPEPAAYLRRFDARRDGAAFSAIVHRWTRGPDIVALLWLMRQMIDRAGSIEGFFLDGYDAAAADVEGALDSFSALAMTLDLKAAYGRVPRQPGVCYFFPRPSKGSACKRLNLFLRWMVRRDALDLGVWRRVSPAMLIVPLDTHVIRVGRCLRLTTYTSPGWRMARDIIGHRPTRSVRSAARAGRELARGGAARCRKISGNAGCEISRADLRSGQPSDAFVARVNACRIVRPGP